MKRRDFIKRSTEGAVVASLIPIAGKASAQPKETGDRKSDKWQQMGTGKMGQSRIFGKQSKTFD